VLLSVKWSIGEKETTLGSFIWRKSPSTLSWDRYSATIVLVEACSMVLSLNRIRLPNSSSSKAARAFSSVPKLRRSSAGSLPARVVLITRATQRGARMAAISAHFLPGLSGPSPGEAGADLGELAMGLREGLVEAPGLLGVQPVRVAHDKAAFLSEDDLCRLEGDQAGEGLADDLV